MRADPVPGGLRLLAGDPVGVGPGPGERPAGGRARRTIATSRHAIATSRHAIPPCRYAVSPQLVGGEGPASRAVRTSGPFAGALLGLPHLVGQLGDLHVLHLPDLDR